MTTTLRLALLSLASVALAAACSSSNDPAAPAEGKAGDSCTAEGAGRCDGDKASLRCRDGKLTSIPCAGPEGCTMKDGATTCDARSASVDAPCASEGSLACTLDGTKLLRCSGGKQIVASDCQGPNKCKIDEQMSCDESIGTLDGSCVTDESFACSVDATKWLKCTGGKFTLAGECAAPETCQVKGLATGCM